MAFSGKKAGRKRRRIGVGVLGASLVVGLLAATPGLSQAAALGSSIASVAQSELTNTSRNYEYRGSDNCTYYNGKMTSWPLCGPSGWRGGTHNNDSTYAWCANFARYVWKTAGVSDMSGLDAYAFSFARYGAARGTLHVAGSGYTPKPGDALVFDWESPYLNLSNIHNLSNSQMHDIDHVGLVKSYSGGTVTTIEGNSSNKVSTHTYAVDKVNIRGYITPVGADVDDSPTPAPTKPVVLKEARIASGDFNGDGSADIAGIDANNNLMLYTGTGKGTLTGGSLMWPSGGQWNGFKMITAGDFNGDGKTDIAGIDADNNMKLYAGAGNGTVTGGTLMWPTGGQWKGFHAIAAGDFTNDGKTDIAGIDADNTMKLYKGTGTGTLTGGTPMWPTAGQWSGFQAITAGDFNGDGKLDIAGIDAHDDLKLYTGDNAGNLAGGSALWATGGLWKGFRSLNAGDFNGDGRTDIAGIDARSDMKLYLGTGTGSGNLLGGSLMRPTGEHWTGSRALVAGDFDTESADDTNPSSPDLSVISATGDLNLYEGTGDATLTDPAPMLPAGTSWADMKLTAGGDFDGDGNADLAAIDATGDMTLYPGDGKGHLTAGGLMMPSGGRWTGFKAITAGDFDSDGAIDIAGIDAANTMKLYKGDGTGHLATTGTLMWGTGGEWTGFHAIAAADFDNDGNADIAGIDANNDMRLYKGDGLGHLTAVTQMWATGGLWTGFKFIAAGDFDDDGAVDIVGIDANNDIKIYNGTGDGTPNSTLSGGSLMWRAGGMWIGFQ